MALQLSLMDETDIPAFVDVDDLAMKDYAYSKAMVPAGQSRKQLILGFMRQGFKQDEKKVYLKVTEHGKLIASALWQFELKGEKPTDDKAPLLPVEAAKEVPMESATDLSKAFIAESVQRSKEFKSKFVGTTPYAELSILFTHPEHRCKGAASMLIEWGCVKADEHGIIATLHSSPEGYSLYLKHGFELVEENELDLRPWGVDETTIRRAMIRQPKTKA